MCRVSSAPPFPPNRRHALGRPAAGSGRPPPSPSVPPPLHITVCQDKHKQKLREMKCSIDNAPPKRHSHLHKNLKKEQLMEERFAEIERDNRLLLEKMSYIMRVR